MQVQKETGHRSPYCLCLTAFIVLYATWCSVLLEPLLSSFSDYTLRRSDIQVKFHPPLTCLLYTSDAADEDSSV